MPWISKGTCLSRRASSHQKLICVGKLLPDDSTPALCGVSERDFLVLVTAKPRPPSLMTTGAPLPPSYPTWDPGELQFTNLREASQCVSLRKE